MGKIERDWLDRDYVLKWFGKKKSEAEAAYRNYVKKAVGEGRRPELVGGGLVRSMGGWSVVKAMRRSGERELSDDRILGGGDFVERIIKEAEEKIRFQLPVSEELQKINELMTRIFKDERVSIEELKAGSRRKEVSEVRKRIAIEVWERYWV
jgi:putative transposase